MHKVLHHPDGDRNIHLGAWHRQRPDPRDAKYSIKLHGSLLGGLPSLCDQRSIQSPVEDQGELGSCTSNGLAACVESNELRKQSRHRGIVVAPNVPVVTASGVSVNSDGTINFSVSVFGAGPAPSPTPAPAPTPPAPAALVRSSRLFTYYNTRAIEGTIATDAGGTCRDTIQAASKQGVCDENLWPYDVTKFTVKPPQAAYTAATKHVVTSYHSIADGDLETIKSTIFSGFDVYFGFTCYDELLSAAVAASGLLPLPASSSTVQGGHAIAAAGYDDNLKITNADGTVNTGAVLIKNSWGPNWAQNGYFYMPYAYISNPNLASDFWVVQSNSL